MRTILAGLRALKRSPLALLPLGAEADIPAPGVGGPGAPGGDLARFASDEASWRGFLVSLYRYAFEPWRPM